MSRRSPRRGQARSRSDKGALIGPGPLRRQADARPDAAAWGGRRRRHDSSAAKRPTPGRCSGDHDRHPEPQARSGPGGGGDLGEPARGPAAGRGVGPGAFLIIRWLGGAAFFLSCYAAAVPPQAARRRAFGAALAALLELAVAADSPLQATCRYPKTASWGYQEIAPKIAPGEAAVSPETAAGYLVTLGWACVGSDRAGEASESRGPVAGPGAGLIWREGERRASAQRAGRGGPAAARMPADAGG
jgi:hypothetical protein